MMLLEKAYPAQKGSSDLLSRPPAYPGALYERRASRARPLSSVSATATTSVHVRDVPPNGIQAMGTIALAGRGHDCESCIRQLRMRRFLKRRWKWLAIAVGALPGLGLLPIVCRDLAIEASFNAISAGDAEEDLTERLGKPAVNTWETPDGTYKTLKWRRSTGMDERG